MQQGMCYKERILLQNKEQCMKYVLRTLAVASLLAGSVLCMGLLAGCQSSGPEKTLKEMATALNKKDPSLFLSQIDMKRYAAAQINNMTQGDTALRALDSVGKMLGLGGMDDLLGSVMNMQVSLEERYTRGVSTGELMAGCRTASSPDCPWVPEALDKAKVKEVTPTTAVAQVTTPTNITSWLALSKQGERWLVVGQAALESQATRYAEGKAEAPGSPALKAPPAPATPGQKQGQPAPATPPHKEKPQEAVRL